MTTIEIPKVEPLDGVGDPCEHILTVFHFLLTSLLSREQALLQAEYRRPAFSFGRTRGERLDTLVIRAVHNLEKTREVLWAFLRRDTNTRSLAKLIHNPPCVARGVNLCFFINNFFEAEEKGYFDFDINPSGAGSSASSRNAEPTDAPPASVC